MDRSNLPDMAPRQNRRGRSAFGTLRQYVPGGEDEAEEEAALEQCELCSEPLGYLNHRHLLEMKSAGGEQMESRQVICTCNPCALRFENVIGGRYRLIPRDTRTLPDFHMTEVQWNRLAIPIDLAFFFKNSEKEDEEYSVTALYPSPAGATESLLPLEAWGDLAEENPVLSEMEPDVEALLVNRVGEAPAYYLAPIDTCYEIAGLIRLHWEGFSGGQEVWEEIAGFFLHLDEKSKPLTSISPKP
jgi:hypothetical protein